MAGQSARFHERCSVQTSPSPRRRICKSGLVPSELDKPSPTAPTGPLTHPRPPREAHYSSSPVHVPLSIMSTTLTLLYQSNPKSTLVAKPPPAYRQPREGSGSRDYCDVLGDCVVVYDSREQTDERIAHHSWWAASMECICVQVEESDIATGGLKWKPFTNPHQKVHYSHDVLKIPKTPLLMHAPRSPSVEKSESTYSPSGDGVFVVNEVSPGFIPTQPAAYMLSLHRLPEVVRIEVLRELWIDVHYMHITFLCVTDCCFVVIARLVLLQRYTQGTVEPQSQSAVKTLARTSEVRPRVHEALGSARLTRPDRPSLSTSWQLHSPPHLPLQSGPTLPLGLPARPPASHSLPPYLGLALRL